MEVPIDGVETKVFTIPTERPEADGTISWEATTVVLAFVSAGGKTGMGYTYSERAAAGVIRRILSDLVLGQDAWDVHRCWNEMRHAVRNIGMRGIAGNAISAMDTALWDLKARLLSIPLADLFGKCRSSVQIYGSGGFTTYGEADVRHQIEDWQSVGISLAKIKIAGDSHSARTRINWARKSLEDDDTLMVDANGAFTVKPALSVAEQLPDMGVDWFEEPVSSDDLEGLKLIRRQSAGLDITAGEYGYDEFYFRRMLEAGAVDVLQIDATRCQGYSGFLLAANLAAAHSRPISSHCAPALHLPVCLHVPKLMHMEYFHDHVRIESMIFDGVPPVQEGHLAPSDNAPGNGLTLRESDARKLAA